MVADDAAVYPVLQVKIILFLARETHPIKYPYRANYDVIG